MTFRDLITEKTDLIYDDVYFEQDDKNIYVVFLKSKEQITYSKKYYYIYGGASKSLQIYRKGNVKVAEYFNSGWNGHGNIARTIDNLKDAKTIPFETLEKMPKLMKN